MQTSACNKKKELKTAFHDCHSSGYSSNSYAVYDICRLQTADCRPQTADCRPQIADCKLKDTKNLPNKGDTIKNITSCESEKVAWEQG